MSRVFPVRSALRHPAWWLAGLTLLAITGWHWQQAAPETGGAPSSPAIPAKPSSGAFSAPAPETLLGKPSQAVSTTTPVKVPFTASPNYPAALAVAGLEDAATRAEALEALMENWVATVPEQAADWAGSLPAGSFRDDAFSALMFHWAGTDPAAAALWMARTGVDDPEGASVLASRWSVKEPAAAAAWASTLPNLETRREASAAVAGAWAGLDPTASAEWAATLPASDRTAAITNAVTTWAASAPGAAAAWLATTPFPTENDRAAAAAALITAWTPQSPSSVSKYINSLPEGPAREAAASQFAVTAAATAPAEALMWAMNLADPVQRNQIVADACETWYDGSPDTFRSGIAEAIALMEDPTMRRGVYEMLYERDPAFQANLLSLADPAPAPPPTPAADPAAPPAVSPVTPLLDPVPPPPVPDLPDPTIDLGQPGSN